MSKKSTVQRLDAEFATPSRKRSILIIKSKDHPLQLTQRFLLQRNWDVKVIDDSLSLGLQTAATHDPEYLFISTNVVPNAFATLYSALKKSFQVVLFAETADARAIQLIREIQAPFALLTPLTGPTVERMIHHIRTQPLTAKTTAPFDPVKVDIERMAHATDSALSAICKPSTQPITPVGHCQAFHCFAIHTARMTGYFVVGGSGQVDGAMMQVIKERITGFMQRNGQFFKAGEIHAVELREVQFEGLALSCGEFFRKSAHLNNEIAIAFFKLAGPEVKIGASIKEGWIATETKEFAPEEPTDFDLYIYLPRNKRFVLYKRAGDAIEERQRQTLTENGVTDFHLPRATIPALQRYKAKTYLNSLIGQFQDDNTEVTKSIG